MEGHYKDAAFLPGVRQRKEEVEDAKQGPRCNRSPPKHSRKTPECPVGKCWLQAKRKEEKKKRMRGMETKGGRGRGGVRTCAV